MASLDNELLSLMAKKMGITSVNSLKKASEFLRLLQLRVTASSGLRQFNDTSRVVMSLDLACSRLGHPYDKSNALRLAGLSKKQYSNGLNLMENLLDLAKPVDVKTLCVQLGVSEVVSFAEKVLNMYVERHSQGPKPLDINLPVYHCLAVFAACKFNKIKVEKSKLIEASRVKRVDFDKLVDEFSSILETLRSKDVKKTATKRSHKLMDLVSKEEEEKEDKNSKEENKIAHQEAEDFESWKKRLLSEAGEST